MLSAACSIIKFTNFKSIQGSEKNQANQQKIEQLTFEIAAKITSRFQQQHGFARLLYNHDRLFLTSKASVYYTQFIDTWPQTKTRIFRF